jgi:hypothetical protein
MGGEVGENEKVRLQPCIAHIAGGVALFNIAGHAFTHAEMIKQEICKRL